MEAIKITKESLDAFKSSNGLSPARFNDKDLLEEYLEFNLFGDFHAAKDNHNGKMRKLIGRLEVIDYEHYIDATIQATWEWGSNFLCIEVLACNRDEDYDSQTEQVFEYYRKIIKDTIKNSGVTPVFSEPKNGKFQVLFYVAD